MLWAAFLQGNGLGLWPYLLPLCLVFIWGVGRAIAETNALRSGKPSGRSVRVKRILDANFPNSGERSRSSTGHIGEGYD